MTYCSSDFCKLKKNEKNEKRKIYICIKVHACDLERSTRNLIATVRGYTFGVVVKIRVHLNFGG